MYTHIYIYVISLYNIYMYTHIEINNYICMLMHAPPREWSHRSAITR